MTQATVKGKIRAAGVNLTERLEDLLTSEVFSRLRYLPFSVGLAPILARIENAGDGRYLNSLEVDMDKVALYHFWPRINSIEPDLFFKVPLKQDRHLAVIVECKHKSGKSPRNDDEDDDSDEIDLAKRDQLVREYLIVETLKHNYHQSILLYITGHSSMPKDELKESAEIVDKLDGRTKAMFYEATYWIGWSDIWNVLRAQRHRLIKYPRLIMIVDDLLTLLAYHGYRSFLQFPVPSFNVPSMDLPIWYRTQQ